MDRHAPDLDRKELPEATVANKEASTTENTAALAEQGATVEPGRASSKKGRAQGPESRQRTGTGRGAKSRSNAIKRITAGVKACHRFSCQV